VFYKDQVDNTIQSLEGELFDIDIHDKESISLVNEKGVITKLMIKCIYNIMESSASNDNTVASTIAHENEGKEMRTDIEVKNDNKKIFNKTLQEASSDIKASNYNMLDNELINEAKSTSIDSKYKKERILCSLDDMNEEEWNQFVTNEQLFKTKSSYTEAHYNTEVDLDKVPIHIRKEAERIENELKKSRSKNDHINEERGIENTDCNDNEEHKYSSVHRNDCKNKKNIYLKKKMPSKPTISKRTKLFLVIGFLLLLFIAFISFRVYKIQTKRELKRLSKIETKHQKRSRNTKQYEYDNNDLEESHNIETLYTNN
jgi:PAB1-binding protein PBP1